MTINNVPESDVLFSVLRAATSHGGPKYYICARSFSLAQINAIKCSIPFIRVSISARAAPFSCSVSLFRYPLDLYSAVSFDVNEKVTILNYFEVRLEHVVYRRVYARRSNVRVGSRSYGRRDNCARAVT